VGVQETEGQYGIEAKEVQGYHWQPSKMMPVVSISDSELVALNLISMALREGI
jgi:hypothetical protein